MEPEKMRRFIRALAWQMYDHSTDSMDPSEVLPLLAEFFPNATEADMSELADVAVVNCPELTKGEETGFEFVHKSFAEYLIAERMAHSIERVIFRTAQFGTEEHTWRMSDGEAAAELAPVIGVRLVTEEVQEMLEPMLGCLAPFLKGDRVDQVVSGETRKDGLRRLIERFQVLFRELLQGHSLGAIDTHTRGRLLIRSPLEAYANQCAGYLIIGTAAARQLTALQAASREPAPVFSADAFEGAFWQCLCLLHAGGLTIDRRLAERLTRGLSVESVRGGRGLDDTTLPIRPALLANLRGYDPVLTRALAEHLEAVNLVNARSNVILLLLASVLGDAKRWRPVHMDLFGPGDSWRREFLRSSAPLVQVLVAGGLVDERVDGIRHREFDHWAEIEHRLASAEDPRASLDLLRRLFREGLSEPRSPQEDYLMHMIDTLLKQALEHSSPAEGVLDRVKGRLFKPR